MIKPLFPISISMSAVGARGQNQQE